MNREDHILAQGLMLAKTITSPGWSHDILLSETKVLAEALIILHKRGPKLNETIRLEKELEDDNKEN